MAVPESATSVRAGARGEPLGAGEHLLCSLDALAQPVLERFVTLAFLDVAGDRCADHLRDRHAVDSGDGVEILGLVGGQTDCHGLVWVHALRIPLGLLVVECRDDSVSWYHSTVRQKRPQGGVR